MVLNTFFPLEFDEVNTSQARGRGISEFGLPYESQQAITHHIGWFLDRHRTDVSNFLDKENYFPNLVLFNGGSLKPVAIQNRILEFISHKFNENEHPGVLENQELDIAVAKGAAYYGLVKIGEGVRVGSGSARGYYIGVKKEEEKEKCALCIVERGVPEGTEFEFKEKTFEVLANQPVSFEVYSSSFRSGDKCGDIIEIDSSLTVLPPIRTIVQFGQKGGYKNIPVHIEAVYTEVGTLELWCKSLVSPHRWQLQFDLRKTSSALKLKDEAVFDAGVIEDIRKYIKTVFNDETTPKILERAAIEIKKNVGLKKEQWPLGLLRHMADELLENVKRRKTSPHHEQRWLNLMGFCLRPGFGDGFDAHRMRKLWKIHGEGMIKDNTPQVRSEWWVMWRRVAGGLSAGQQKQFLIEATPLIFQKKKKQKKLSTQEQIEIWMAVANMERLKVVDKVKWATHLLRLMTSNNQKPQYVWVLSRFGARELLYGSTDRVVPTKQVWSWVEFLLKQQWKNTLPVISALRQMTRKTGDRTRDFDDEQLHHVAEWILQNGGTPSSVEILKKVVPFERQEENLVFGESLPMGLVLREDG